ncbi:olfactory receptor 7A17-like [Neofelis nebulosa]|uniref:olfactory receptor 7A17-like n=1 Tax=Neofelis nebulosa TaxID=61452 RepID=UPI0027297725|nr:olfactory receptor 7A17-like [Neofelis nebulosa]
MYLITVFGNLLIILAISCDSHLHTPMYFFLANLSFIDICFTSTTVPKMLWNIQTQSKVITYASCITQMNFFITFAGMDDFLLSVMAYDRFVAICHPLHYTVIMNPRLCGLLVLMSWLSVVSLFYCASLGVYLSSAVTQSSHSSATASVMYTVVTPMLNPFIYSLRNRDIKRALKRILGIQTPPDDVDSNIVPFKPQAIDTPLWLGMPKYSPVPMCFPDSHRPFPDHSLCLGRTSPWVLIVMAGHTIIFLLIKQWSADSDLHFSITQELGEMQNLQDFALVVGSVWIHGHSEVGDMLV